MSTESRKAKTSAEAVLDPALMKAASHPLRVDLLRIFNERVTSPAQAARELDAPLGNVAHHVRVLLEARCIELVDTRQVRGATEHFYAGAERANISNAISKMLPQNCREGITGMMLREIVERTMKALSAGVVDQRNDRHISWQQPTLDEEGWRELIALKAKTLEREMEIEAAAAGRIAEDGNPSFPVLTASLGFEVPAESG